MSLVLAYFQWRAIQVNRAEKDKMLGITSHVRERYRIRTRASEYAGDSTKWVLEDYRPSDGVVTWFYGYFSTWEDAHNAYLSQVS